LAHVEEYSIHGQPWPAWDESTFWPAEVTLVVQIDGRARDRIVVDAAANEEGIRAEALGRPAVQRALAGREVSQIIVVPGKVVNVVTGP